MPQLKLHTKDQNHKTLDTPVYSIMSWRVFWMTMLNRETQSLSPKLALYKFETILDVLNRIPEFIEEVYNKKRIHSSLGYVTPEEFELQKSVAKKKKS